MKTTINRTALELELLFALFILSLLLWSVKVNQAVWTPPEAPELTGVYAENDHLSRVEILSEGCYALEAIAIDNYGYFFLPTFNTM